MFKFGYLTKFTRMYFTLLMFAKIFEIFCNIEFIVRANHQVNPLNMCRLVGFKLSIATRYDNKCSRIESGYLTDHRLTFLIGCISYRTGVDHINISFLFGTDPFKTL